MYVCMYTPGMILQLEKSARAEGMQSLSLSLSLSLYIYIYIYIYIYATHIVTHTHTYKGIVTTYTDKHVILQLEKNAQLQVHMLMTAAGVQILKFLKFLVVYKKDLCLRSTYHASGMFSIRKNDYRYMHSLTKKNLDLMCIYAP